jgi:Ca-activated chloride channel family protein
LIAAAVAFTVAAAGLMAAGAPKTSAPAALCPVGGLTVMAAPDIAASLVKLKKIYADTPGRICPQVQVVARSSADVADALTRGWVEAKDGSYPDVWIPDSSVWSRIVEARQAAGSASGAARAGGAGGARGARGAASGAPSTGAAGNDVTNSDSVGKHSPVTAHAARRGPPVAYSPLVLALPEAAVAELGWATNPPRWADLVHILTAPEGWGVVGHPEWGAVELAVVDPSRSAVGLDAVMALVGAIRGLEMEDYLPSFTTKDPAILDRLDEVRAATIITPDMNSLLAQAATRAESGRVTLSLTREHDVLTHNLAAKSGKLAAVYPVDGTPMSDYPYLLIERDGVQKESRTAAAEFLRFLDLPETRDWLVSDGFRYGLMSEGRPFTSENGLSPALPRALLPATGGSVLADLAKIWDAPAS